MTPRESNDPRRWTIHESPGGSLGGHPGPREPNDRDGVEVMPVSEHEKYLRHVDARMVRVIEERDELAGQVVAAEDERDRAEAKQKALREAVGMVVRCHRSFRESLPFQPPEAIYSLYREKLAHALAKLAELDGGPE